MPSSRQTIVVAGMIAADPHQGGATWAVLQYLLGFRRLGHDTQLIEPIRPRRTRRRTAGRGGREGRWAPRYEVVPAAAAASGAAEVSAVK